jgi:hypothetical protein
VSKTREYACPIADRVEIRPNVDRSACELLRTSEFWCTDKHSGRRNRRFLGRFLNLEFCFPFFVSCRGLIEGTSQQADRTKLAGIVC